MPRRRRGLATQARLSDVARNIKRVLKGRIGREDATRRIEAVLARLRSPSPYLVHVSRVVIYGSYARGALRVGDIDLAIDYDGMTMIDRAAVDVAVRRLASALEAVKAVSPSLVRQEGRARLLASDAHRLRRQLQKLPPTHAMFHPLRHLPAAPGPERSSVVDEAELEQLEQELQTALDEFEACTEQRLPLPSGTPPLVPNANLMRMVHELSGDDNRISIYHYGADMPNDRATEKPTNPYWVWHLLWERGDPIELALKRLRSIPVDRTAGRAPRSGQTGRAFKP